MAWTAWLVAAVVVASLGYLVWAASRRAWNAGGEDDARRDALAKEPAGEAKA